MKTRAELADELLKMIDAGISNKQATAWLSSYETKFGPEIIVEVFKSLGIKLCNRAEEDERELEQDRAKAKRS